MIKAFQKNKRSKKNNNVSNFINSTKKAMHQNEALFTSIVYGIFGVLWILLSDNFLNFIIKDSDTYKELQTYKGWLYILITTMLVYLLIRNRMRLMQEEVRKTAETYTELSLAHEELVAVEAELKYQKDFTESIIQQAPVIIATWDEKGKIKSLNPFGQKLFGYKEEELINKVWLTLLIPEDERPFIYNMFEVIDKKKHINNYECPIITRDGRIIEILWNCNLLTNIPNCVSNTYVSIGTDIEERIKYEEKIKHMAYYDALTGLPNRAMLETEINKRLDQDKEDIKLVIAYLDIDNFKYINDSLGHQVGDIFLKYFGDCLKGEMKSLNFLARVGGDEFAIVFHETSMELLLEEFETIKNRISKTWSIQNRQFYISMSVGIVIYPDHGNNATILLKNANIAMYAAKREGKNRYLFYRENIEEYNFWQVQLINNLQYAIDNEQFVLFYQPQFNLSTGKIVGVEALVRWVNQEGKFVAPIEFIPLAEDTGQIYRLERLIVNIALMQKQRWEEQGFNDIELSINLSSKTLTSDVNFEELDLLLSKYQVDYSNIVIEITETASISGIELVIGRLDRLKIRGIKIALDDFGTGYSSLNYLKKFPIDIVKLDKSFVNSITDNGVDRALVKNIVALAHDLEFEVVAEGIETKEQLEYLRTYCCEIGQGYLLSRPLPIEMINDIIKKSLLFKG